jgi:hypothetical protein
VRLLHYNPETGLVDPQIPRPPDPQLIRIHKAHLDGFNFHLNAVKKSPKLLEWVLRKDFFDYKRPEI